MNIEQKYLPIGTVCVLKGASKKLMITGFCIKSSEEDEKIYDYLGCLYPEGVISSETNLLFDHEQIENVFYMGYSDDEEKSFKKKLDELIKNDNLKDGLNNIELLDAE